MTFTSDDESTEDHSREFSVEQLRASLKANNRAASIDKSSSVIDMEGTLFPEDNSELVDDGDVSVNNDGFDYDTLNVADDIRQLFNYIDTYEPIDLELETPLKCFIPPYIPAVGEVDPMIKIPRPDGLPDGIGITHLDEIIPANQSNKAVIELQLRNWSKTKSRAVVRSIANAAKCPDEIDQWIKSVEEIHENEPQVSEVRKHIEMPELKELLKPLPKATRDEIKKKNFEVPSPAIDLSLSEYAQVLCSLIGIPVHDGSLVESVHTMYNMFIDLRESEQGQGL